MQNSTAFGGADYVEQIVDIPVRGELQGFHPGQGSASSSSRTRLADEAAEGEFLRTFPSGKKSAKCRAGECESARALQVIRAERSSNGSSPVL